MAEELESHRHALSPVGRTSQSLLHRRWSEFAAELVLIVVGILAALAIDGWMQDRHDRGLEDAYLGLLLDDLDQIEAQLLEHISFEDNIAETGKRVLEMIAEPIPPADTREMQELMANMSVRRTLLVESAAYADLTSTGNLQLIRNAELRRHVNRYFAMTARSELIAEKNSRTFVDESYYPFLVDRGITIRMDEPFLPVVHRVSDMTRDLLGENLEWPTDDVLLQPRGSKSWDDIWRQVYFRIRIALTSRLLADRLVEATQALRAEIEAELQNPI